MARQLRDIEKRDNGVAVKTHEEWLVRGTEPVCFRSWRLPKFDRLGLVGH